MTASMESSGQTRAATLMNEARRSHFVSRIEKYEAKVRHAKALMKEKDALAMAEQRQPVSNMERPHAAVSKEQKETIANQRRPTFDLEEQHCYVPERKMLIPTERPYMHFQVPSGSEQISYTHHDPPYKQEGNDLFKSFHHKNHSPVRQPRERGYLSQEESLYQHPRGSSPDHKTQMEQKEIISGVLQRSASSNVPSIMGAIDALDIKSTNAAIIEKEFPVGFEPSETHANIYFDFKPPPTAEATIATIAGNLKIRIKAADMSAPMQEHAFRCARECLDAVGKLQSKRIAYTLKKEFDKVYGPAWHCIVGTSFGSYVTHSLGGFVYFSLDKVSVLLFKTTVEPIENS